VSKLANKLKFFFVLVLLGALGATVAQSIAKSDTHPKSFAMVRDLLAAEYPELLEKGWYLDVSSFQPIDDSWHEIRETHFKVTDKAPSPGNPTINLATGKPFTPQATTKMEGFFQADKDGQLERFYVWNSDILKSDRLDAIRKQVQDHPQWSEEDAILALKNAGATYYGPTETDKLLQAVRPEELGKILGRVHVESAEFEGVGGEGRVGTVTGLYWSVRIDTEGPKAGHRKYALTFEPFGGKLTGILHLR
jgi:hypothetical protein